MKHQILSYLSFSLRATNQHGVHSPFVYALLTECFYDKKKYDAYKTLKNHRAALHSDSEKIEVTDFGAGSKVFKTNNRKVADIAKHAGITKKRQRLLFRIVQYLKPKAIVELGTSLGMATTALALGNPKAEIKTVEGCPNTLKKATDYFAKTKLQNIKTFNQSFDRFFKESTFQSKNYTIRSVKAFIDGALGSRGAALFEPYSDDKNNCGLILISTEEFSDLAHRCRNAGFQLCTHAIGDKGNQFVLDTYNNALSNTSSRWRVEHAQMIHDDDIEKFTTIKILFYGHTH